ncbi:DNA-3-methyladenine glycosylase [Amycolatopsis xylanica]|uniref:Putative 3-methyladenine DNA glycosylase n=1 Tax=Amycolatopsis xylanica TaxID=589385 RepID=A0A1H3RTZ2_9PSEU|nr:DNA-3-methyladenine glycosylase [Amycolatopsis xylanica]
MRLFTREELSIDPVDLAKLLLGSVIESTGPDGTVAVRLVEVEAYRGQDDPASHCYRGKTPRNAVMWGPAGFLYVYFVYGMHFCANVVGSFDGHAGAVLLRAGEVVSGADIVRKRRPTARGPIELAKGPAILTSALRLDKAQDGADLLDPASPVRLYTGDEVPESQIKSGPRVGVAMAMDTPWRFWIDGSPAVSTYRRGGKRRTRSISA